MSNLSRQVMLKVRRGKISPMRGLDIAVTSRLRGQPLSIEHTLRARVRRIKQRGKNPLLCK